MSFEVRAKDHKATMVLNNYGLRVIFNRIGSRSITDDSSDVIVDGCAYECG